MFSGSCVIFAGERDTMFVFFNLLPTAAGCRRLRVYSVQMSIVDWFLVYVVFVLTIALTSARLVRIFPVDISALSAAALLALLRLSFVF